MQPGDCGVVPVGGGEVEASRLTRIQIDVLKPYIRCRKHKIADTGWRSSDMLPRFGPYPATKPFSRGWEWRSVHLRGDDGQTYRLLFEADASRGRWKAMLIILQQNGEPRALVRLEAQLGGSGGGLHAHASCGQDFNLRGAESVTMAYVIPDHGRPRRRRDAWTKPLFCKTAAAFFRTDPLIDQEEMTL